MGSDWVDFISSEFMTDSEVSQLLLEYSRKWITKEELADRLEKRLEVLEKKAQTHFYEQVKPDLVASK